MGRQMASKLGIVLVASAILFGGVAHSATFNADPDASRATIKLGSLAAVTMPRNGTGTASLTGTKPNFTLFVTGPVWQTTGFGPGTSLFTGVPFISNLLLTFTNPTLYATANSSSSVPSTLRPKGVPYNNTTVANPVGPGNISDMVGFGRVQGRLLAPISIGTIPASFDLSNAGAKPVATNTVKVGTPALVTVDITMGPWFRDTITMTNLTTNYVQVPGRPTASLTGVAFTMNPTPNEDQRTFTVGGNFVTSFPGNALLVANSVRIGGTSNFPSTASGTGTISLVTPLRMVTGEIAGTIPTVIRMKFSFVPEPHTFVLLMLGAAGLALFGRNRMGK